MSDAYRAVRQFERFFGYKGRDYQPVSLETGIKSNDRLIATIVYNKENGSVKVVRPGELELKLNK
jgi:hypothetical protein